MGVVDEKASGKHLLWSSKKEENLKFDLKDGLCPEVAKVEQQFLDKLVEPEAEADDDQEGEGGEGGEADADLGHLGEGVLGVEGRRAGSSSSDLETVLAAIDYIQHLQSQLKQTSSRH